LHDFQRHQAAEDLSGVSVVANLLQNVALSDGLVADGFENIILAVSLGDLGSGCVAVGL